MYDGAKIRISEQKNKFYLIFFSSVNIFGEARDTKKRANERSFFGKLFVLPDFNAADGAR